ncbi:ATP-binding protein [Streptomyces gilvosporeus]|nr:ATP-binding protein [Streptomyces gilvosporeus]
MSAAEGALGAPRYAPHPYVGGRTAALRALAAWRMCWPGAPRVIALTGDPGSGRSRLLTGFLMMCDPAHRKKLPLYDMDPATVPPDLPVPAVPDPTGRTADQVLRLLADHFGLDAARREDIFTELAALEEPVSIVVPDVDRAGPIRAADEPARLVADVLTPLAALKTVQLLADVPRALAAELVEALPSGQAQIIDLDAAEWADPEGLVRYAETALGDAAGAPELPYTTDPVARRALAEAMADRADGSRLTVRLGVRALLTQPDGFDPADASLLPGSVGEALDLHARRLGSDPETLRSILAPLALAEGAGLPARLLAPLASAVAGRDMSREVAEGMPLAAPFIEPVAESVDGDDGDDVEDGAGSADGPAAERPLLRLIHPALADDIRSGLPDIPDAQARIAMALLEAVPEQDWSRADPYVRDRLAAHTLEAGLLPQLLTDPGLFAYADPVVLRAAVEAVPLEQLGAPARTYLRTAPLLIRSQAPVAMRAALLETAFVEDGLGPYADALHTLGLDLPWRTLWSAPLAGVAAVTTGLLPPEDEGADARPVAAFLVPEGTPGSRPRPGGGKGALLLHHLLRPGYAEGDPARVQRPSKEAAEAAPYGFTPGADSLRVWDRPSGEVVTAVISDAPFTGADLSPDGVLVLATEVGVTARQILVAVPGGGPHHGAG